MSRNIYTIDFETYPIINGSNTSPAPVGVSVKLNNEPSKYYAWGHPSENNSTIDRVADMLGAIWESNAPIVCHNSKFDLRVANDHFGLSIPNPSRIIDTMIMMYLVDPREESLSLKPLTEKYCGMPPDEQTDLNNWIVTNIPGSKINPGAHICNAPGKLVGRYAESDTDRTYALYKYLEPMIFIGNSDISHQNIWDAFDREMQLLPIVIQMEQNGVTISDDIDRELPGLEKLMAAQDIILGTYSDGAAPGSWAMFNAFRKKGLVDESKLQYTDKGNPRFGKNFINDLVSDNTLRDALILRSKLQKIITTYMRPFSKSFNDYDGKFHPYYNQTRSENHYGTRTGRFSSNVQQLPKDVPQDTRLPNVRKFITPNPGRILIKRDFCFTDDTEFLTQDGFKFFDDIESTDKLAYWDKHNIDFELPIRRIDQYYEGAMCNMFGSKSIDICTTIDHDMVLLKDRFRLEHYKIKSIDIPFGDGHKFLPQSGNYDNVIDIDEYKMILLAAFQADGSLRNTNNGLTYFKFSKERKISRLIVSLSVLKIPFKLKTACYECDDGKTFHWICINMPNYIFEYVSKTKDKTFTRKILTLPEFFIEEVKKWDGYDNTYMSTNKINIELVQELCVLRNRFAHITIKSLNQGFQKKNGTNKKLCYLLNIHKLSGTYIKTQTNTISIHRGRVVCFEMPHGTLVLRRNGKPFIAGNCAQEIRVLAHYAEGNLLRAFRDNPDLDPHSYVHQMILDKTGQNLGRTPTKVINFLKVYGGGSAALSAALKIPLSQAQEFFSAYDNVFPEPKQLMRDVEKLARSGKKIRTWGGRSYDVEIDKFGRQFYYKLVNVLIQGSSADMTKEAMIRYHYHPDRFGDIFMQVHDEIVIETDEAHIHSDMRILKWAMDDIPGWDVPLRSEGKFGYNFFDMEHYLEGSQ